MIGLAVRVMPDTITLDDRRQRVAEHVQVMPDSDASAATLGLIVANIPGGSGRGAEQDADVVPYVGVAQPVRVSRSAAGDPENRDVVTDHPPVGVPLPPIATPAGLMAVMS